jgi:hypothetical protein
MHALFEFLPFLVGSAYGLLAPTRGWISLVPAFFIGALFAWFAGELTNGVADAIGSVLIDSTVALIGCVLARFARRFVSRTRP